MSRKTAIENGSEVAKEEAMSSDVVPIDPQPAQTDGKQGAIQLHEPVLMVSNRPVMPSDIEVAETITVAGVRPIAASHLHLAGSFLNGRPIESSALKVQATLPGDRPIFMSDFKEVEGGALLPGHRPIMASDPKLLHGSALPGGRPIASNEIDDPIALMGYLD